MSSISSLLLLLSILGLSLGFRASRCTVSHTALSAGFGKAPAKDDGHVNPMTNNAAYTLEEYDVSSPRGLIQSRFSAYKRDDIPFIIATTSDQSPDYRFYTESPGGPAKNMKKWARDIAATMTRDYWYVRFEIDSEEADPQHEDIVNISWRLLAIHKASNVMYPISEKTTLIREDDEGWKYVLGEVSRPAADVMQTMMEEWPKEAGISLKVKNEEYERQLDEEGGMSNIATGQGLADKVVGDQRGDVAPNRAAAAAAAMRTPRRREGPDPRSNPKGGAFAKSIPRK